MPREVSIAPALRSDLGAVSKLDDSPPPEYNEVIQQEIIKNKTDTVKQDVENVRRVKRSGCFSRTLNVFKIILVLVLLTTFALAVLITYRHSYFDQDLYIMERQVENLQRRVEDLYSTIYDMEKRLDSNHPTPPPRTPKTPPRTPRTPPRTLFRPAQSYRFGSFWPEV